MSLQVWLPFNKQYVKNVGIGDYNVLVDNAKLAKNDNEYGYTFKGDSVVNIKSPSKSNLEITSIGENGICVFFWIAITDFVNTELIFTTTEQVSGETNNHITLFTQDRDFHLHFADEYITFQGNAFLSEGQWFFIGLNIKCLSDNTEITKTYKIDFISDRRFSREVKTNSEIFPSTNFLIGGHPNLGYFDGIIRDFKIYNSALSDIDIDRIMCQKIFDVTPFSIGTRNFIFDKSGLKKIRFYKGIENYNFNGNSLVFNEKRIKTKQNYNGEKGLNMNGRGTISVWFNFYSGMNQTFGTQNVIFVDGTSNIAVGIVDDNSLWTRNFITGKIVFATSANQIYKDGSLNNVIIVYDSASGQPKTCYINGASAGVSTDVMHGFRDFERRITIGGLSSGNNLYNCGEIYNISVYKKVFIDSDALTLYNNELEMFS